MKQHFDATDSDTTTMKQFYYAYNIKKAIENIDASWKEVTPETMNGCWKKVWPECVSDFGGFTDVADIRKDIVRLSHLAGFTEVDEDDVQELLESHEEPL